MVFKEPFQLILFVNTLFPQTQNTSIISLLQSRRTPPNLKFKRPATPGQPILLSTSQRSRFISMGTPLSEVQLEVKHVSANEYELHAIKLTGSRQHWRYTPASGTTDHKPASAVLLDKDGHAISSQYLIKNMSFSGILLTLGSATGWPQSAVASIQIKVQGLDVTWPIRKLITRSSGCELAVELQREDVSAQSWDSATADKWKKWSEFLLNENFSNIVTWNAALAHKTLDDQFSSIPGQHRDIQLKKKPQWLKVTSSLPWHIAFNAIWDKSSTNTNNHPFIPDGVVTLTFARIYAQTSIGYQFGRTEVDKSKKIPLYAQYAPIRDLYFYSFSRIAAAPDLKWVAGSCRAKHFLSIQYDFAICLDHNDGCSFPIRLIEINFLDNHDVVVNDISPHMSFTKIGSTSQLREQDSLDIQNTERCHSLMNLLLAERPLSYVLAHDFAVLNEDKKPCLDLERLFLLHINQQLQKNKQPVGVPLNIERQIGLISTNDGKVLLYTVMDSVTDGLSLTGVLDQLRLFPYADCPEDELWAAIRHAIKTAITFFQGRGNKSFIINFDGNLAGPPELEKIGIKTSLLNDYGPGFCWVISTSKIPAFLAFLENRTGATVQ